MGQKCFAPGCKSGYASNPEKVPMYKPSTEEIRKRWNAALPRTGRELSMKHAICEKHFAAHFIEREKIMRGPDGTILARATLGRPKLLKTAIPSIFPNLPKYYSKVIKQRKPPMERGAPVFLRRKTNEQKLLAASQKENNEQKTPLPQTVSNGSSTGSSQDTASNGPSSTSVPQTVTSEPSTSAPETVANEPSLFEVLCQDESIVQLPNNWVRYVTAIRLRTLNFAQFAGNKVNNRTQSYRRKCITINENLEVFAYVNEKDFSMEKICGRDIKTIANAEEVSFILESFTKKQLCSGIWFIENIESLRSQKIYLDGANLYRCSSCPVLWSSNQCPDCQKTRHSLLQSIARLKRQGKPLSLLF